ncbi:MAG TPA: hypothetical protein VFH60_07925 [Chloroflexia bacterium]|nr:hypothetical protein [Chloroflexia bacterium]
MRTIPDDAFYYLQTARHIAAGDGSTFDGLHPTNGYHPLWMLTLVPFSVIAQDSVAFTRLALALSILCSLLSAAVFHLLLRRLTTAWWIPPLGAGLYFLNSQAIVSNLNGLETSLSTLFFVALAYLVIPAGQERQTTRQAVLLGLCLGLLFLARTDNAFYIGMFFLVVLVRTWKSEMPASGERAVSPGAGTRGTGIAASRAVARTGATIAVAAAVVAPWLAWNLASFGSIVQSSGLAIPHLLQESYRLEGHTDAEMFQRSVAHFASFFRAGFFNFLGIPAFLFVPAALLCGVVLGYAWRNGRGSLSQQGVRASLEGQSSLRAAIGVVGPLWVAAILLVFTHTFIRWNPRDWYFDQMIALSALTFCLALIALNPGETIPKALHLALRRLAPGVSEVILRPPMLRRIVAGVGKVAVAVLLLVPLVLGSMRLWNGIYPHQVELLDAAYWLKANTAPGEIAAGFNSGIMGFFSDRPVVNLDGVMNNAAYVAITKKDLAAFMEQSQVRYYVDFDPQMVDLYARFMGDAESRVSRVPVAAFERPNIDWYDSVVRAYRLDWLDQGLR